MLRPPRSVPLGLLAAMIVGTSLPAQETAAPANATPPMQSAPAQAAAPQQPQVPPGFQLNPLEQTYLDEVLAKWEQESAKITNFKCAFSRQEFNAAFGPGPDKPFTIAKGELSYQKPDKGSFQVSEIKKWQAEPIPPGQPPPAETKGDWVVQPDAIGEHWVCDGLAIYEYRHNQKQLVVRPIPKEMQGKAIVDGPLPFLFGAEATKLKQRFFLRIHQPQQEQQQQFANVIWVQAKPRFQAQAADFEAVEVLLDRQTMLPTAMQVYLPNKDRHLYTFDLSGASVNSPLARIQSLFQSPSKPWGWTKVVEQPTAEPPAAPGMRQAAQPGEAPR